MKITDACKCYFNGFSEISKIRSNDTRTNVLAALKIFSYITIIIPLGFAAVCGCYSLCGRVKKPEHSSDQDQKITCSSKEVLSSDAESTAAPQQLSFTVIKTQIEIPKAEDVPSNLQELLAQAKAIAYPSSRVQKYCEIAKQQVEASATEAASRTLDIAVSSIPYSRDMNLESLYEIAQIRMMITPGVVPNELNTAKCRLETQKRAEISSSFNMWPSNVNDFCSLAIGYHQVGDLDTAQNLIKEAKICTDSNKLQEFRYLRNLLGIAETQIKLTLVDAAHSTILTLIQPAEALRECPLAVTMLISIAILLRPYNEREAQRLVLVAESKLKPYQKYDESEYSWLRDARVKLQCAKEGKTYPGYSTVVGFVWPLLAK